MSGSPAVFSPAEFAAAFAARGRGKNGDFRAHSFAKQLVAPQTLMPHAEQRLDWLQQHNKKHPAWCNAQRTYLRAAIATLAALAAQEGSNDAENCGHT